MKKKKEFSYIDVLKIKVNLMDFYKALLKGKKRIVETCTFKNKKNPNFNSTLSIKRVVLKVSFN